MPAPASEESERAFVAAFVAVVCAVIAYFALPSVAATTVRPDPDAFHLLEARVERATRAGGWVPARSPARVTQGASVEAAETERILGGAPIVEPPLYPLVLAMLTRRAPPDFARIMTPEEERTPLADLDPLDEARVARIVRGTPRILVAFTALFAALAAAALVQSLFGPAPPGASNRRARTIAVPLVAVVGGLGAGLFPALVGAALAPLTAGNVVFAAALFALATWGTFRALDERRLDRPFQSAVRGAAIGVALGFMVGAWTPSLLGFAGLQVGLAARLRMRYRKASGELLRARALPVFVTSIHKTAILVLLPTVIESPTLHESPWSLTSVSWLHVVWPVVGWLWFAPYALVPRGASQRPTLAALPGVALAAIVLGVTGAGAALLRELARFGDALPLALQGSAFGALAVPPVLIALALLIRRSPLAPVALGPLVALTVGALCTDAHLALLAVSLPVSAAALVALAGPRAGSDARVDSVS